MDTKIQGYWNDFWETRLKDDHQRGRLLGGASHNVLDDIEAMRFMRRRGVRRILIPGNGCTLFPHALVHAGYEVTVVDISPIAIETVASRPISTPEKLKYFFPKSQLNDWERKYPFYEIDLEGTMERIQQEAREGGSLELIVADIREWNPPPNAPPFDLIYEDRMSMLLSPEDWPALAQSYSRWLSENGICIIETVNFIDTTETVNSGSSIPPVRNPFEKAFDDAGFQEFRPPSKYSKESDSEIDAGIPAGKIIYICHGSG